MKLQGLKLPEVKIFFFLIELMCSPSLEDVVPLSNVFIIKLFPAQSLWLTSHVAPQAVCDVCVCVCVCPRANCD